MYFALHIQNNFNTFSSSFISYLFARFCGNTGAYSLCLRVQWCGSDFADAHYPRYMGLRRFLQPTVYPLYCTSLQYSMLHCTTLQYNTLHCITVLYTALYYHTLLCIKSHSTLLNNSILHYILLLHALSNNVMIEMSWCLHRMFARRIVCSRLARLHALHFLMLHCTLRHNIEVHWMVFLHSSLHWTSY